MSKLLEVNNLSTSFFTKFGEVKAVNNISFELEPGQVLAIVGESGSGKSVTSMSVMRLVAKGGKIIGGSIMFDGKDLAQLSEKEMAKIRGKEISMIFQDPMTALNPVMTVGEQLSEVVINHEKVSKAEAKKRVIDLLEIVGVKSDRYDDYPHQFSGGQKQRVVIAMSLLCNPKLLIADEPTTALDVTIQAQVLDIINQLREQYKMAMVLITHDLGVVAETCDNVAIMYAGQIVEAGTVREVYLNPKHPYTRGLFDSIPKLDDDSTELIPIEGAISNAADLPTGCYFHPRCRYCQDICKTQQPTVKGEGHKFMCHFDLFSKEEEK